MEKSVEAEFFAERLRALRKSRGLAQRELAQQLGVATGLVGTWEIGKSMPRPRTLSQIAGFFRVPAATFLRDSSGTSEGGTVEPETQNSTGMQYSGRRGAGPAGAVEVMARQLRDYVERLIEIHHDDPARMGWILHEMRTRFGGYPEPLAGGSPLNEALEASPAQVAAALLRGARARAGPTPPASPGTTADRSSSSAAHPPGHEAATATKDDDPPGPSCES